MKANSKKYPYNKTEKILDLKVLTDTCVRNYNDKPAFKIRLSKTEVKSITYNDFGRQLCALANTLIDKGFQGKRIALIGENSYPWVLTYLSVVNINATIVPLDKELTAEEICELVKRAGACALFHSPAFDDEAVYAAQHIPELYTVSLKEKGSADDTLEEMIQQGEAMVAQGSDRYSNIEIDRERACSILFTSGTTGKSKGVMLSHTNLGSNIVSACELVKYTPNDVFLSILPIHHTYENMAGIVCPLNFGSTIAFCESVKLLPECLALFRPTIMVLVPLYLETFYNRIWESARKQGKESKLKLGMGIGNLLSLIGIDVRDKLLYDVRKFFGGRLGLIISGGAYLNPMLVHGFKGFGITVVQGYGITECSPIISVNRNKCLKAKSVGWIMSCNDVKIDDDGQILVKGDNVMIGYLDDEQGTINAFDGDWYKTGDLGYMDKDGFLYVTGRCKNLIVLKNGKNIMPDEIESLLQQSPLIAEAMVKESRADANGSESVMAIIYPDPAVAKDMNTKELCQAVQAEVDAVNQKLVLYKRVQHFVLRSTEFPKTTTKKIQRYKVAKEG